MNKNTLLIALSALVITVFSIQCVAAFGDELSYSGINVRNSSSQLWNGEYTVITTGYATETSTTVLFSSTSTVNITNGNFVVKFNNTLADKTQTFWVLVNISSETYPRFQYTAAAQAHYASTGPFGNITSNNGTSGWPAVFTNSTNIHASFFNVSYSSGWPDVCPSPYYMVGISNGSATCALLNLTSAFGSGLTTCNLVTEKLAYNTTSGVWSCQSDREGGSSSGGNITGGSTATAGFIPFFNNASMINGSGLYWDAASQRLSVSVGGAGRTTLSVRTTHGAAEGIALYPASAGGQSGRLFFENSTDGEGWALLKSSTFLEFRVNATAGGGSGTSVIKFVNTGDVNVTGSIYAGDTVDTDCIVMPGGGKLCGNSTCVYLVSPDAGTKVQSCN